MADAIPVNIARCPEHGLHGSRLTCFQCGRPCDQVPMVPAGAEALHPIEVKPGAVYGIDIDASATDAELQQLADAWKAIAPDSRLLILGPGMSIRELSDDELAELLARTPATEEDRPDGRT